MTQNFVTEICCGYRAVYLAVIAEWSACCASEYQKHIYIERERFSFEYRKTKTKVITLANHKGHRQNSEPIKTRSNYM